MSYISLDEEEFCLHIKACVKCFLNRNDVNRNHILLFPPLSSRGRFLIHKSIEFAGCIASVSIGENIQRRVIVFFTKTSNKSVMSATAISNGKIRTKPDMQLYVPKHRRSPTGSTKVKNNSDVMDKGDKTNVTKKINNTSNDGQRYLQPTVDIEKSVCNDFKSEELSGSFVNTSINTVDNNSMNSNLCDYDTPTDNHEMSFIPVEINNVQLTCDNKIDVNDSSEELKLDCANNVTLQLINRQDNMYVVEDSHDNCENPCVQNDNVQVLETSARERKVLATPNLPTVPLNLIQDNKSFVSSSCVKFTDPALKDFCVDLSASIIEDMHVTLNGNYAKNISQDKLDKIKLNKRSDIPLALSKYSEDLSKKILTKAFQKVKADKLLEKNVKISINFYSYLEGMANNFVNNAIENAMEILRSVNIHEKKLKIDRTCSKTLIGIFQSKACQHDYKQKTNNVNKGEIVATLDTKDEIITTGGSINTPVLLNDIVPTKLLSTDSLNVKVNDNTQKVSNKKVKKVKLNKKSKTKNILSSYQPNENADSVDSPNTKRQAAKKVGKLKRQNKYVMNTSTNNVEKSIDNPIKTIELCQLNDILNEEVISGDEDDNWDSNFAANGECINEEMKKELSRLTGVKDPVVEKASGIDYLNFVPKNIELDDGEFGHIVEIFDFSSVLKTQDIFFALKSAGIKDFNLTWVDDNHALAVFASRAAAHASMKQYSPMLQMRQVINGTRQSRLKAREFKDSLLPYKPRPTTSAVVARNLVASSLGLKSNITLEQRRKERAILQEAKEKKRQKAKSKRDIWEDPD